MRTNELHASAKQVQRSKGRSSVAAAAYRSGELLYDERTGLTHDYTKKGGVEYARVYIPDNAPDDLRDRNTLWNAVESKENRSNSCTAREFELAFPHEFNVMQRYEAGDAISRELLRRYNCAVDIAYHQPNREGDERNYHAHILFTTRGFDENTKDGWSKNKYRDLNNDKLEIDGESTTRGKAEVNSLRKFTAGEMNRISDRDNLNVKTEHLSFEARGIDKEPTKKMGFAVTQAERRGVKTDRGDINRAIKASNDNLGNTTMNLQDQKKILILEQQRALLALEQERDDGEEGEGSGTWQSTIATFKKEESFPFHQKRVEQVEAELRDAKDNLDNMGFIERITGEKYKYTATITDKEEELKTAKQELTSLQSKETLEQNKAQELNAQVNEILKDREVTPERTAQYKQEQGELTELQTSFENRNNIDRIIGAITGKTAEQKSKIEELQGNIKSYEADKRIEEIKQRQEEQDRQETLARQRDIDRSNDNRVEQEKENPKELTKEEEIEVQKQEFLDRMAVEREEKGRQEAITKGYDYQPYAERGENDKSLSDDERKQAYLTRMDKQREQEAAHKEKIREAEKVEYESRPENNPELSSEERKQAYLDRCAEERENIRENPERDKGGGIERS